MATINQNKWAFWDNLKPTKIGKTIYSKDHKKNICICQFSGSRAIDKEMEEKKNRLLPIATQLWTSPITKKKKKLEVIIQIQPKILDNNIRRSHMDRCNNISENQTKSNKTKWREHPPIFNKSILFNSRIKFLLKNKLNKK